MVWRPHHENEQGGNCQVKNEVKHTAHSSYRCEYHIVFAPKYRRKVIYKELRADIGAILRKLCNQMKEEIIFHRQFEIGLFIAFYVFEIG